MEQHLGHQAFYQNLRRYIDALPQIEARWVPVTYQKSGGIWDRIPFLTANIRGTLSGRSEVRSGLSAQDYDVAFYNTQVPAALGGDLVRRKPYVLCTDITPIQYDRMAALYDHRPDRKGLLREYKHRVNYKLFHHAARLLPWSSWVQASLENDYEVPENRIEVIPPGVDTEIWKPVESSSPGGESLKILFVGGDFHRKGGITLLEAFRRLPPGAAQLILVTRSHLLPEPGVIVYNHMQPNSTELINLYRNCDVFVLPTHAEAFGVAAVEASSMGMPVIGTKVGGLPDIVIDGTTGFLVPPGDVEALVSKLCLIIDDLSLRHQLGSAARKRVKERFDARKNAERVAAILRMVILNEN